MKDPLEEAGTDVTRRGAGISLLLVLLGLIVLAVFRPSTIDTLAIIFGIVALIMLHEAGHYFTAKRAGMKVTEFFLGFGPRVWSFRRGETEYGVKAIPAGGYVRIVGMSNLEDVDPDEESRTFRHAPFGNRLTVILAGVTRQPDSRLPSHLRRAHRPRPSRHARSQRLARRPEQPGGRGGHS